MSVSLTTIRFAAIFFMVATTAGVAAAATDSVVLLTADGEGHVAACATCPNHRGLGGLDRRATAFTHARASGGAALLLDAGNWLAGAESIDSRGKVIVAAYESLGYDAVHLTPKDLYWGKVDTLTLLKDAKFAVVSSNLLDEQSGAPLVSPFVVKTVGGRKIAILGVSEPPAGMAMLPHVRQQLAGVRVRPIDETIDQWLPKAKAESDQVLVLYQGRGKGLRSLQSKLKGSGAWILAGGVRPENLPPVADGEPPIMAAAEHGKSIGRAALGGKFELTQIMIEPTLAPDPAMEKLLASYRPPPLKPTAPAEVKPPAIAATAPASTVSPVASQPPDARAAPTTAPAASPAVAPTSPPPPPPARVAAHQPHQARGLAGVGLTVEQVNASIDRGAKFLYDHLQAKLKEQHRNLGEGYVGTDLLACLALVHAGVHKKQPEFDKQLREFLRRIDPISATPGTYENGVLCMLIEDFGDPTLLPLLQRSMRRLIEQQGEKGTWTYQVELKPADFGPRASGQVLRALGGHDPDAPMPGVELRRNSEWERGKDGDNSATQFAALGLRSASRCGFKAPAESWTRLATETRRRQCVDGGWAYENSGGSYGSMTCAGICTLSIARHELGEADPAADEAIERGLAWLVENFAVAQNPRYERMYQYYYLYSLERVGRLLDTEFIGPNEWYPLGAKFLVEAQRPDGRWVEARDDEDPVLPASFALLFLTRATATLKMGPGPRGGRGTLLTTVTEPPPAKIHLILDASGSMLAEMDGHAKLDVARDAIAALADQLPPGTQVGLRVYGHRKRSTDAGAEEDSALEIPLGALDPNVLRSTLQTLRARGKTPLAFSLREAVRDVQLAASSGPVTVLLLTDGGDDTSSRGGAVQAAAELGRINGVTLHVVGFDIPPPSVAQLQDMAKAGNGRYWAAGKADDLRAGLAEVLLGVPEKFTVLDAAGATAGDGRFGTAISLPEGQYRLVTRFGGRPFVQDFWINTNATTAVLFDSAEALVRLNQPATAPAEPVPSQTAKPRFCTSCGAKLTTGAKFCTSCGAKVAP
jgi:hypothetical protein